MKNNSFIVFIEKGPALFYGGNLRRAGAFFTITGTAKSAFKTDPLGNFYVNGLDPAIIGKPIFVKQRFKFTVFDNYVLPPCINIYSSSSLALATERLIPS